MEAVYCDNCAHQIVKDPLLPGNCFHAGDGKIYCAKCALKFNLAATAVAGEEAASAKSPAQDIKFYFCETCGKRITDQQIREGLGRDKKLKGVYCANCAAGVMTMEMDAVNIAELAKTLRKTPPSSSEPEPTHPQARKGSGTIRSNDVPQRHARPAAQPGAKPDTGPSLLVVGIVLLTVGVMAAIALSQKGKPRDLSSRASTPEPAPAPRPSPPPEIVAAPKTRVPEPAPIPATTPVPEKSPSAPEEAAPLVPPKEEVQPAPAAAATQPVEPLAPAQQAAPVPQDPPPAAAGAALRPPPEQRPDEMNEARMAHAAMQKKLVTLLRNRDRNGASELLAQCEKNPVFKPMQTELAQEQKTLKWLAELDDAVLKGAERLKTVDDFELQTLRGQPLRVGKRAAFQFIEMKDGALSVGSKGASFSVQIADLHPRAFDKLTSPVLAEDAAGLTARAFAGMLAIDGPDGSAYLKAAQRTLEQARAAGALKEDVDYLSRKLDGIAKEALESAAVEALARFESSLKARNWIEAVKIGNQLLTEHAGTAAVSGRTDLKELVELADIKRNPVKEFTLTFQEGQPVPELAIKEYSTTRDCYLYSYVTDQNTPHLDSRLVPGTLVANWTTIPFIAFTLFRREGGKMPDDAEILSARLLIYRAHYNDPPPYRIELRRILSQWKHTEATWLSSAKGTPWKTPGGDKAEQVVATCNVTESKPCWCELDVTDSLRQMQKDGNNFGWSMKVVAKTGEVRMGVYFASSRNANPELHPKLIIKARFNELKR